MPDEDLRDLARCAARSLIRLQTQLHDLAPLALSIHERRILGRRKDRLQLAVDSARATGDLPDRDDLMAELLLTEDAESAEEGELGVAAALIIAAIDGEPE